VFQRGPSNDEGWMFVEWRDKSVRVNHNIDEAKAALENIKKA